MSRQQTSSRSIVHWINVVASVIGLAWSLDPANRLRADEPTLIAHWPLSGSAQESISSIPATARQVEFNAPGPGPALTAAAHFNGRDSQIEVANHPSLQLGTGSFSISMWVHTAQSVDAGGDSPGDLLSQFDPATRTGFHLGIHTHGGVTNAQPNSRQLTFGIDQGQIEENFTDHGRLGTAIYVFSLCVHKGRLYAATCHAGENEAGHVFRHESGETWTDLGTPDHANSISALAVYQGELYAASSKYRLAGSALSESQNPHSGGKIFKLGDQDQWTPCGTLSPETEAVGALVVFRGRLYAGSLYKPAGFFCYEGGQTWTACPTPSGKRVEALTVYNDALYASCYDEAAIFRFDGEAWESLGTLPEATQTYGFAVHRGDLYVSEWPLARVFRAERVESSPLIQWKNVGRLGQELEAMPLLVYNGMLYGGTLPLAEVYRFDHEGQWARIGRVDHTPDVKFRRAWSMAVHQGRMFVGALPSGRVKSISAGRCTTWDHEFPSGWQHIAAVRDSDRLRLYVGGTQVAESQVFDQQQFNLNNNQPLQIGFGPQDYFHGQIADLRLYHQALSPASVQELSQAR